MTLPPGPRHHEVIMGLFDAIKKRHGGAAPAAEPTVPPPRSNDPAVARMQRMMTMSIAEWLIESAPDWAKCDAAAPATGTTTAGAARHILMQVLPLDEPATVAQMPMFLMAWGALSAPAPVTFNICSGCGEKMQFIGDFGGQALPETCGKCNKPVNPLRIEYSRETGTAIRAFLADHARCCAALKTVQTAIKTELNNPARIQALIKDALATAQAVLHVPAIKAIARASRYVNLTYLYLIATMTVQDAQKSPADSAKIDGALAAIRAITVVGGQFQTEREFPLAIGAYTQSTSLLDQLLALAPAVRVRKPLAYDLDELGILLRVHEPERRTEALAMVRRALQLLEENREAAGAADEELRSAIDAIREHLRMEW